MSYYSRNKTELLALTGAIYSFVAYLTAFALEVLFIIDLTKRQSSGDSFAFTSSTTASSSSLSFNQQAPAAFVPADQSIEDIRQQIKASDATEKSYLLIICIAISILYFIVFVASLILIVALILRSCLCILVWLCIITTMYLPELGLNVYSAAFGWGLDSRNGKTEIVFYALRAILNVIFVVKAHKLYKEWHYEKNFFRLKCASRVTGYESPYFIDSDSLSTTINPVFSESNYDLSQLGAAAKLRRYNAQPTLSPDAASHRHKRQQLYQTTNNQPPAGDLHHTSRPSSFAFYHNQPQHYHQNLQPAYHHHQSITSLSPSTRIGNTHFRRNQQLYDDFGDDQLEMNLDYRTLTRPTSNDTLGKSIAASQLSYSTQSLDRRNPNAEPDYQQVVLRPLGHRPFEYLHRPGSTPGDLYKLDQMQVNSKPISSDYNTSTSRLHRK